MRAFTENARFDTCRCSRYHGRMGHVTIRTWLGGKVIFCPAAHRMMDESESAGGLASAG